MAAGARRGGDAAPGPRRGGKDPPGRGHRTAPPAPAGSAPARVGRARLMGGDQSGAALPLLSPAPLAQRSAPAEGKR